MPASETSEKFYVATGEDRGWFVVQAESPDHAIVALWASELRRGLDSGWTIPTSSMALFESYDIHRGVESESFERFAGHAFALANPVIQGLVADAIVDKFGDERGDEILFGWYDAIPVRVRHLPLDRINEV